MSRFHNLGVGEEEASRDVKKQKYPLDDYLNNSNVRTSLLSPMSPVSSPETVDVLQSAERLVKNAQKQIMEVSFNSALNTLDENPSNYTGQQPLDERLLYVREIVDSKFQECNDPNRVYIRKDVSSSAPSSNRKLQHDQFPAKLSNGILNRPLEISEQNSGLSANRMASGTLSQNEKPFFKKAPNWFRFEPTKYVNVPPTSTASNTRSGPKVSTKVPYCTSTNTGVIEINSTDHPAGTIQVQTGPTVDIRRELTIQTIENVHISPDPSAVPSYNNTATYCFHHEPLPSSSIVDSKNVFDLGKERHIQSTDYNDIHKVVHIESTRAQFGIACIRDPNNSSGDTIRTNNSNHSIKNSNNSKHYPANYNKEDSTTNSYKLSVGNENIQREEVTRRTIDHTEEYSHSRKSVIMNTTPIDTSVFEKVSVIDAETNHDAKHESFGEKNFSKDMEADSSYDGQKLLHIQSDKDHVPRSRIWGDKCGAGSCLSKCERDVEYRDKQKLKEALEAIANIENLRFDTRDTGIVPAECTQSVDTKHCLADAVKEFERLSEPEHFKTALENLCKSSQNTKASKISTDSHIFQGAIKDFVKMFFDPNSQSNPQNSEDKAPTEADVTVDKLEVEMKQKEATKIPKQVKLNTEPKEMEYHRRPRNIVNPKMNSPTVNDLSSMKRNPPGLQTGQSRTGQPKESNKYPKPLMPSRVQQRTNPPGIIFNDETRLENLDLKQPCVSDVDAVLKIYHQSMAAICLGTEQLSQLISRHIMKNAIATANRISSTIPNSTVISSKKDSESRNTRNDNIPVEPVLNLVSCGLSKIPRHFVSVHQKNSTEQNPIYCNQTRAAGVPKETFEQGSILQRDDHPRTLKNDAAFSNENNSVCTNETLVTATNKCSLTCSRSLSEREQTLSDSNEKSSPLELNNEKDISNPTVSSREFQHSPLNITTQSASTEPGLTKAVPKSEENRITNIQYCVAEPLEETIPIVVTSDEKNSTRQSNLKNPLSTYLDLENACGRDTRSHRRSSYDIHSDQNEDFNSYRCPVLIPGPEGNLNASSDCNDELMAGENIIQRREMELQIFGQILDAVKSSSQYTKRSIISLFNGMEIDSVSDVLRNLKEADVNPIIIEQFLLILKERNTGYSLFGGNLMLTNSEPKNYKEPTDLVKTEDNINNLKHSTGFNGSMEITNMQITKGDEDLAALQTADTHVIKTMDTAELEMNLNLEFNKDPNLNSQHDEVLKNKLSREPVASKMAIGKHITEEDLKNKYDNLSISKITFEKKSASQNMAVRKPQQDYEGGMETETCQSNSDALKRQSNTNEWSKGSASINTASKNNDSESNTDKDISFQIPHDADVNNEVLDLSIVQKLAFSTLENGNTGGFVKLEKGSNGQNSLQLNSLTYERSSKMNSNSQAGKSSMAKNKSNGKLKSSNVSASDHASSTKNLQTDDKNYVCHCRISRDHEDSNNEPRHIPCPSSLDAVNAIIDLQIQNDYQRLGLLDPEDKASCRIPNEVTLANERMTIKRSRPPKFGATPSSNVRKATDPGKLSVKTKKPLNKKVSENRKLPRDNKQGSARGARNMEGSDTEKPDSKHFCALCRPLQGKCRCTNCAYCRTISNRSRNVLDKPKNDRKKPVNNISTPRQSRSPKGLEHSAGKSPLQKESRPTSKELSSQLTALPLECKGEHCSYGIVKNDGTKMKEANDEESQNTDFDAKKLKVEDRLENMVKTADVITCKSKETFCTRAKLLDKACAIVPTKLDKIVECNTVDRPQVKDAGTLECSENCLPSTDLGNDYSDRMNTPRKTETKDFSTVGSQTSENGNNFQKHQATSTKSVLEAGTASVLKTTCLNFWEDKNIVVLQPLNELDHTFFIAKPNCVERQMIQEKLNRNFNVIAKEITDQPFVNELDQLDQHDEQTSKDAIKLNSATSAMSCVKSKECQAGCPSGIVRTDSSDRLQSIVSFAPKHEIDSQDSFQENLDKCPDLCTTDEDCLGICPQSPPESDDSRYNCKQDCSNEETCRKLCVSVPQVESSLRTSSIDINGIVENLKKFIADNNVPHGKLRIVKDLLQELKKVQDSMNTNEEKLGMIDESFSEQSQSDREMKNADKPVDATKPKWEAESPRRSIQYNEPDEKVERMVMNKKSLILHNVVRSVADMHPSTKWERLKLRTTDPLVAGNFNKSEADKRYAVFNKPEPGISSIDLNDPRIKAHLESAMEAARMHKREYSDVVDASQSVPKTITRKLSASGKFNNKHTAKLNKSRRGMDADTSLSDPLNTTSIGRDISMKSFESSDLEPGEFLQVRTPFDDPTKSQQSRVKIDWNIGKVSQDELRCKSPCNNDENELQSAQNIPETMNIENRYEVYSDFDETILPRKKNRDDSEKTLRNKTETISPYIVESLFKSDSEFGVLNDKAKDLGIITTEKNLADVRLNRIDLTERKAENLQKHSDRLVNRIDCCNRPQIIDHFLGKRKLEDMKVEYTNDNAERMSKGYQSRVDGKCQQLYMKAEFTSNTTHVLERTIITKGAAPSTNHNNEKDWRNSNEASIRCSDHTSSDTYSEGEINLPNSCSYSVGEIKLSTPSSTAAGRCFKDPDGFTIFVTRSVLDSTQATCTSPGEILAAIQKTVTDSSSSLS